MANKKEVKNTKNIERIKEYAKAINADGRYNILQVYLFGSRAKGTSHVYSDYDVAFVSNDFLGDIRKSYSYLFKKRRDFGLDIEPHPFTPKDLENKYFPLANEVRKFGIPIL